jgi:ABC-type branched-subunit amino acid transport system substrate-binding protein
VADADKLNDTLVIRQALRKPGLDKVNLIVGPVYATSFTIASRFARKNNIPLVNPLSKRENITDENPFVIKVQPSGPAIAAKLAAYISAHYPHANVVAVRYDKKDFASAADRFGELFKSTDPEKTFKGTYHETLYTADQMAGVVKKLESGQQNIVVFFTNNKTVVPNFISLLSPHAKSNDLILIGMDGWDEMDLETEFLVNMNFHQVVNGSVDYESPQVEQFITRYKNKYGASPIASRHAFLGYDIGWHFLTALMLNGTGFMNSLPGYHTEGLQYRLDFSADGKNSGISNQQVDIVKLVDYKWVKAE